MDSDDIALPARFERQFSFMEEHPEVIVCGSNVEYFGARAGRSHNKIESMDLYRAQMLFCNPGPYHPTAFMNRELLRRYQLEYDESLIYYQDYCLWSEASWYWEICILEDVLLRYRVHAAQISTAHRERQLLCGRVIQKRLLEELLGSVTEEELNIHCQFACGHIDDAAVKEEMLKWFDHLAEANDRVGIYDKTAFETFINEMKLSLFEM